MFMRFCCKTDDSSKSFQLLQEIQVSKPFVKVIFKAVILPNPPLDVNMLDIFADRVKFLGMKPKKKSLQKDMGQVQSHHALLSSLTQILSESLCVNWRIFKALISQNLISSRCWKASRWNSVKNSSNSTSPHAPNQTSCSTSIWWLIIISIDIPTCRQCFRRKRV